MSILNIQERNLIDNSITSKLYHTYLPYSNTGLNKSDEIRIPIQTQDNYTYPAESLLEIEGVVHNETDQASATINFINNGIPFLFDELRYELGGVVIDRVRNPGMTSTMKGYPSLSEAECIRYHNASWSILQNSKLISADGHFNSCIPLKLLMGVFEDFQKVIINMRQELVLIRSSTDNNAVITTVAGEKPKIRIDKLAWKIEHIRVDDETKLKLVSQVERGIFLPIGFRSWELHELPTLMQTTQQSWSVKSVGQIEKPRFIIFGFQTDKQKKVDQNMSLFDHCHITNFRVKLNEEVYPYDNLKLDFDKKRWSILYEMYARFQQSYYNKTIGTPCLSPVNFAANAPLIVVDCCYQVDSLKNGNVDIRLEFETSQNIPANTSAYCLILHDRKVKYNSLTNIVKIM